MTSSSSITNWDVKKVTRLLQQLYDKEISIEEFKAEFKALWTNESAWCLCGHHVSDHQTWPTLLNPLFYYYSQNELRLLLPS